jgi:16S rRNA (cytidine1402-2'-O)-methyltransferase
LAAVAGPNRRVVIGRELTKLHEELRAGTLGELADYYSTIDPKGELTVVLEGTGVAQAPPDRTEEAVEQATAWLADGLSRKEVIRRLTDSMSIPRNEAYRLVMELP